MKKILAILLALTCLLASVSVLTACGEEVCEAHVDENKDNKCDNCGADVTPEQPDDPEPQEDKRDAFVSAIGATNPEKVTVTVKTTTKYGELTSTYVTTFAADGSFTVDYTVEKFNDSLEATSTELKIVETGTITCNADGSYSDGGAFAGSNPQATGVKLNIKSDKVTEYNVNGDNFNATVKAADTKDVFGVEYKNDATLVLTKNNGKIVSASVISGDVQILCVYA